VHGPCISLRRLCVLTYFISWKLTRKNVYVVFCSATNPNLPGSDTRRRLGHQDSHALSHVEDDNRSWYLNSRKNGVMETLKRVGGTPAERMAELMYPTDKRFLAVPGVLSIHLGSQGLCCWFSGKILQGHCGKEMRVPGLSRLDHGVELHQELAHACHQGHFCRLAGVTQVLVETFEQNQRIGSASTLVSSALQIFSAWIRTIDD
jgi:hypothetical protein